jgi:hypothetical protein
VPADDPTPIRANRAVDYKSTWPDSHRPRSVASEIWRTVFGEFAERRRIAAPKPGALRAVRTILSTGLSAALIPNLVVAINKTGYGLVSETRSDCEHFAHVAATGAPAAPNLH